MNGRDRYCKARVAIVAGWDSSESEISLSGARAVHDALKDCLARADLLVVNNPDELSRELAATSYDAVFVMVHGTGGEDGTIQTVLDEHGIPYTGSGASASRRAWDKLVAKERWLASGLSTPEAVALDGLEDCENAWAELAVPCVVKPRRGGSSLGLSYVNNGDAMVDAYRAAAQYDGGVMVERALPGPEYTVSIVSDHLLPVTQIRVPGGIYDYEAKYDGAATEYICPAELDKTEETQLYELSFGAFEVLGCSGWARVDLMRDQDQVFQLLEVNTVPGMTKRSLVPLAARTVGMDFTGLSLAILDSANIKA